MSQLALIAPVAPSVQLDEYDAIFAFSSAGKDSQVMLDEVILQADEQGVDRRRVVVIHCDLGRVEWAGTVDLAREHAEAYGLQFLRVERTQGDLLTHVEQRGMWPGPATRYCTADHKRAQGRRVITALSRIYTGRRAARGSYTLPDGFEWPFSRRSDGPLRFLEVLGLRAEESRTRARLPPYALSTRSTSLAVVDEWLPVHHWTEVEVWDRIDRIETRHHHAYVLGMPRLSCCFCIFAGRDALTVAGAHNIDLLREYVRVEAAIDHTFTQRITLASILADVERGAVPESVAGWQG